LRRARDILLFALPATAWAHSPIEGVDGFYAGLLHPLAVPSQLLVLMSLALVLGGHGLVAYRSGMLAFLAALVLALLLGLIAPSLDYGPALLVCALLAAGLAMAAVPLGPGQVGLMGALGGMLLGIDTGAEQAGDPLLIYGACTGLALVTVIASDLVLRCDRAWQRLARRVLGSWLAASAILGLAFAFAPPAG
jgi:urease accessory protein